MEDKKRHTDSETIDSVLSSERRVILREPYYGFMLLGVNKRVSKEVPTAAVHFKGVAIELLVNADHWFSIPENEQDGTLIHELLHVAFGHLTNWRHLQRDNAELANIAMDIEVNQYVPEGKTGEGWCTLEYFEKELGITLEPFRGCKYYYETLLSHSNSDKFEQLLKKMREKASSIGGMYGQGDGDGDGGDGNGSGTKEVSSETKESYKSVPFMPSHDFGEESDGRSAAENAQIASIMEQAAVRCAGNIPGRIKQALDALRPPRNREIDWKKIFKMWTKSSESEDIKTTRKKLNRRCPENPGFKRDYKLSMLAMVDTSGSVSDALLSDFLDLLQWAQKEGADVTLLQFDHAIQDISKFDRKKQVTIYGRGGTSFQEPMDYYRENRKKFDCGVFFSDGYAPRPTSFSNANLLWILQSGVEEETHDFPGKKVYVRGTVK